MRKCPTCACDLGPWEDDQCLTCSGGFRFSIHDRAIGVLERASQPLAWWDVKRHLDSQNRGRVVDATASQVLADDLRACWSGRGIYGMYRHGLLPGVRDLGRVAGIYIHVSDTALTIEEIYFIMRHVGYRFSFGSLEPAVWRVQDLGLYKARYACGNKGSLGNVFEGRRASLDQQRAAARAMRFPQRTPAFHHAATRAATQAEDALAVRQQRLG